MLQVRKADVMARIPPPVFFFVSAIFHYLGMEVQQALIGWEQRCS